MQYQVFSMNGMGSIPTLMVSVRQSTSISKPETASGRTDPAGDVESEDGDQEPHDPGGIRPDGERSDKKDAFGEDLHPKSDEGLTPALIRSTQRFAPAFVIPGDGHIGEGDEVAVASACERVSWRQKQSIAAHRGRGF